MSETGGFAAGDGVGYPPVPYRYLEHLEHVSQLTTTATKVTYCFRYFIFSLLWEVWGTGEGGDGNGSRTLIHIQGKQGMVFGVFSLTFP